MTTLTLEGKYIKVGVNDIGTLGSGGSKSPGLLYDPTGTGTFNTKYDFLTPGTPFEGFYFNGSASSTNFTVGNNNTSSSTQFTGSTLTSYNGAEFDGATYDNRAVWTGTFADKFSLTMDYGFNADDTYITINTKITALADLSGLTFGRAIDPDAQLVTGDSSYTKNSRGYDTIVATDLVTASSQTGSAVLSMFTATSFTHNTGISSGWSTNPAHYLSGVDDGNGDYTIGLGIDLGNLTTGSSASFKYHYVLGPDLDFLKSLLETVIIPSTPSCGTKATSSITGPTCIGGGTLIVDTPYTSVGVDIDLGTTGGTVDTGANMLTLERTVSGGTLTKTGSGMLVLSAANSHTSTVVNAGTLVVNGDAALGAAGAGISLNNGTFWASGSFATSRSFASNNGTIDTGGNTLTLGGTVSGSTLTKTGSGTLVLIGTNSHTGTAVNGGTLAVNGDAALGAAGAGVSLSNAVFAPNGSFATSRNFASNNGTIDTGANTLALGGTVSGSTLTKTGSGTLVLTGTNTHAGTVVNGGTLAVNGDAALGAAGAGVSLSNAVFAPNRSFATSRSFASNNGTINTGANTLAIGGTVSGRTLTKTGSGTLVLTGTNSHTGTAVNGGTLAVNGDAALGAAGAGLSVNNGTFTTGGSFITTRSMTFNNGTVDTAGHTLILGGTVNGTGCFIKNGQGTLQMAGVAHLAQGACVQQGEFSVNGTVNGRVTVLSGGSMSGTGIVRGNMAVDGVLRPGNSPGTLRVAGSVTMNASGVFEAEIDGLGTGNGAGNYDRLIVGGSDSVFSANGTLRPVLRGISGDASNSFTPSYGNGFAIVSAEGGVSGRFAALEQPTAGLAANMRLDVTYSNNDVVLWATPETYAKLGGLNQGQAAAAVAVDALRASATAGSDAEKVLWSFYPLDQAGIGVALNQAAGTIHADALAANLAGRREFGHAVAERQANAAWESQPGSWTLWGQGVIGFGKTGAGADSPGFSREHHGVLTGADKQWTNSIRGGFALGYLDSSVDGHALGGNASVESFQLLAYGSVVTGEYRVDGGLGYGYSRYDTSRSIGLAGLSRSAEGDTHSHDLSADLAVSRTLTSGKLAFTPRLGLRYDRIQRASYSEKSAGVLGLAMEKHTLDALEASVELTARASVKARSGLEFFPYAQLGYARDLLDERIVSRNSLGGNGFAIRSADDDRDTVHGGLGVSVAITPKVTFQSGYKAEYSNDRITDHAFNAGVTVRW